MMRACATKSRIRVGLTLVELMVVLAIMSVFALAATRLVHASFRLASDAQHTQDSISRFDSALSQLCADVWSAGDIRASSAGSVLLTRPDGSDVVWEFNPSAFVRTVRDAQPRTTTWDGLPEQFLARSEGPMLVLSTAANERLTFTSQFMLATRMKP